MVVEKEGLIGDWSLGILLGFSVHSLSVYLFRREEEETDNLLFALVLPWLISLLNTVRNTVPRFKSEVFHGRVTVVNSDTHLLRSGKMSRKR